MADIINLDDRRKSYLKYRKKSFDSQLSLGDQFRKTIECLVDLRANSDKMKLLIQNLNELNPRIKNLNFMFNHIRTLDKRLSDHLSQTLWEDNNERK